MLDKFVTECKKLSDNFITKNKFNYNCVYLTIYMKFESKKFVDDTYLQIKEREI